MATYNNQVQHYPATKTTQSTMPSPSANLQQLISENVSHSKLLNQAQNGLHDVREDLQEANKARTNLQSFIKDCRAEDDPSIKHVQEEGIYNMELREWSSKLDKLEAEFRDLQGDIDYLRHTLGYQVQHPPPPPTAPVVIPTPDHLVDPMLFPPPPKNPYAYQPYGYQKPQQQWQQTLLQPWQRPPQDPAPQQPYQQWQPPSQQPWNQPTAQAPPQPYYQQPYHQTFPIPAPRPSVPEPRSAHPPPRPTPDTSTWMKGVDGDGVTTRTRREGRYTIIVRTPKETPEARHRMGDAWRPDDWYRQLKKEEDADAKCENWKGSSWK